MGRLDGTVRIRVFVYMKTWLPIPLLCLAALASLPALAVEIKAVRPSTFRVPLRDGIQRPALGSQDRPAIATDGTGFLAVWADHRYGTPAKKQYDIFASRLDARGVPLDPLGVPINPTWGDDVDPSVVWDGSAYQIFFGSPVGLIHATVTHNGVVASSRVLVRVGEDDFVPRDGTAAAILDESVVVIWAEHRDDERRLRFVTVRDGVATAPVILPFSGRNPSLASEGARGLLVWEDLDQVHAALIAADGVTSSDATIGARPEPSTTHQLFWSGDASPQVAFDGSSFAVAWTDGRIHVQGMSREGALLATPVALSPESHRAITPAIIASPSGWDVMWGESESDITLPGSWFENLSGVDLRRTTLDRDLNLPTVPPMTFKAEPFGQYDPAFARTDAATVAVWHDERLSRSAGDYFAMRQFGDIHASALSGPDSLVAYGISNQTIIDVVVSQDVALVLWSETTDDDTSTLYFDRVTLPDLAPVRTAVALAEGQVFRAAAAGSGGWFMVVWSADGASGIMAHSTPLRSHAPELSSFPLSDVGSDPEVAGDGNAFLVVWTAPSSKMGPHGTPLTDIRAARVQNGLVTPFRGLVVSSVEANHLNPLVTWSGDGYLVAWSVIAWLWQPLGGQSARFVTADGIPLGAGEITIAPLARYGPRLVSIDSSGSDALIGRGDFEYGNGLLLPSTDALVRAHGGTPVPLRLPYVAWDGASYLAAASPMDAWAPGAAVIAETVTIEPLPRSHDGTISRVFLSFAEPYRARAVRR